MPETALVLAENVNTRAVDELCLPFSVLYPNLGTVSLGKVLKSSEMGNSFRLSTSRMTVI